MQLALVISLAAVGTVLATRTVLRREIPASYAATHPADATLEVVDDIDDAMLAAVRARPEVETADRRQMIPLRSRPSAGEPWQTLLVFVTDDAPIVSTFAIDQGVWPPPAGALFIERSSVPVMGLGAAPAFSMHGPGMHGGAHSMLAHLAGTASSILVETAPGVATPVSVAGVAHDAGQAPSWQEHRGVAFTTRASLAALGQPVALHDLLVRFRSATTTDEIDRQAHAIADTLRAQGHAVHEVRVPTHREHPHQGLMNAVQTVLLVFTLLLFALASIVVATLLSTILARQTRDIGMMKAVGATTPQLASMYGAFVLGLGAIGVLVAMPLSIHASQGMVFGIASMMNLSVHDASIPHEVFVVLVALGLVVPLAIAAIPVLSATRRSVRDALADHGARMRPGARPRRLPLPVRNALRRPARLALTATLLVVGGGLVIAAAHLDRSLSAISSKLALSRHFDAEIRLRSPAPRAQLVDLGQLDGVRTFEAWSASDAALGDTVRTYPDGGHGSFHLVAAPTTESALMSFTVTSGRWLAPGDIDAIVLGSHGANATPVGSRVTVTVDGVPSTWTVVGTVDEMGGSSGFITLAGYRRALGDDSALLLRFATTARTPDERAAILDRIESTLATRGLAVRYTMPAPVLRSIIDDHVVLVVRAVILMAALLGLVGLVGLGAAMSISVAERTRELAIMKTIGASDARLFRIILAEAAFIGAASALLAAALSFPLAAFLSAQLGSTGLLSRPPFHPSIAMLLAWPLVTLVGSLLACFVPARRASRLTVARGLSES
ncbi:MAG TPA: FtsX-like permease family protein [Kofleriaceae bacterium]